VSSRNQEIEERIRLTAQNTDKLIIKLDTLSDRMDMAKANENQELIEYYERKFAEASVEFMDGVETILDDWYELNGERRPDDGNEELAPDTLDEIHNTVVAIVQGLPLPKHLALKADEFNLTAPGGERAPTLKTPKTSPRPEPTADDSADVRPKRRHNVNRVDLKG
jgi:hypothetical protein